MKPIIRSVAVWGHPNIRTWSPDNPDVFAEVVSLDIGPKSDKGTDSFSIRVASPAGLAILDAKDNIIAARPLLVMQRYDYDSLWRWLEEKVALCEAETWPACVENLRRFFDWEYDNYSST